MEFDFVVVVSIPNPGNWSSYGQDALRDLCYDKFSETHPDWSVEIEITSPSRNSSPSVHFLARGDDGEEYPLRLMDERLVESLVDDWVREWEDEDVGTCSTCAGSGEGYWDGSRCSSCKGSGVSSSGYFEEPEPDFELQEYFSGGYEF